MDQVLSAIRKELILQKHFFGEERVSTIYFGGGTPSLLSVKQLGDMLTLIAKEYQLSSDLEITLEANPDDLDLTFLRELKTAGINRLSIGIQSFQQPVLSWMNRAHSQDQSLQCLPLARDAGFENISIDLIYGIPLERYNFEEDLQRAVEAGPNHISAYNLTIEPKTVFGHQLANGKLHETDEEDAANSFLLAMERLKAHGFHHYEISNFCQPGKASRHNLGYWNGSPYLGIGPSAHSFDGQNRQFNVSSNGGYLQSLSRGIIPSTKEVLSASERVNEQIMLGLRTDQGLNLGQRVGKFEWDLKTLHHNYIKQLIDNQMAVLLENKLILTDKGKLLADKIAEDLFVDSQ